jgi:acyl-CoA thioesterase-2
MGSDVGSGLAFAAVPEAPLDLSRIFVLEPHGPDTFVGESPAYSWGRIYGGLVVAQALWAATQTVDPAYHIHSLHAYFILGGDLGEPVRYEVDRVRNGRSFTTRRVLARQSGGAILTLGCSFQVTEPGPDAQAATFPADAPDPSGLPVEPDAGVLLAALPPPHEPPGLRAWARLPVDVGDDPRLHACGLAYVSDVNAIGAIARSYPGGLPADGERDAAFMSASLDHAMWFHRPARPDGWLLLDMRGHGVIGSRGLATGQLFRADGTHVATIAQEGLLRERRC